MKKSTISLLRAVVLTMTFLSTTSCVSILNTKAYPNIKFKVVAAQTGKPIAGAVLLVQWTKPSGFSSAGSTNYKVVEVLSDQNGMFTVPGAFRMGLDAPRLVVYKRGYVAWQNEFIFPDYKRRTNFKWRNGYVFELEEFDESKFTHRQHTSFINDGYSSGVPYGIFKKAWEWENSRKFLRKNNG